MAALLRVADRHSVPVVMTANGQKPSLLLIFIDSVCILLGIGDTYSDSVCVCHSMNDFNGRKYS